MQRKLFSGQSRPAEDAVVTSSKLSSECISQTFTRNILIDVNDTIKTIIQTRVDYVFLIQYFWFNCLFCLINDETLTLNEPNMSSYSCLVHLKSHEDQKIILFCMFDVKFATRDIFVDHIQSAEDFRRFDLSKNVEFRCLTIRSVS